MVVFLFISGAQYLYHIDGNHKLRRYQITIHGCVCGFSRLIIMMKASDNNRAETVRAVFVEAVHKHGWAQNIRTDHGKKMSQ